jgi:hypothetical protein
MNITVSGKSGLDVVLVLKPLKIDSVDVQVPVDLPRERHRDGETSHGEHVAKTNHTNL